MARLTIKGKGLSAIIRDTRQEKAPGGQATSVDIKKNLEEKEALYKKQVKALAEKLDDEEKEKESLKEKVRTLEKRISNEIPPSGEANGSGEAGGFLENTKLFIDTLKAKAEQFDKKGNLLDAFHLYRRMLRIDPENTFALRGLAVIYYSADLPDKAIDCLRAILEIDPMDEDAAESLSAMEDDIV